MTPGDGARRRQDSHSPADGEAIPDSNHEITLEFAYDSPELATIVAESVRREIGEIDDDRSRTSLSRDRTALTVEIRARDLTALRSAANTWFSLVDVAERTVRLARPAATGPDAERN